MRRFFTDRRYPCSAACAEDSATPDSGATGGLRNSVELLVGGTLLRVALDPPAHDTPIATFPGYKHHRAWALRLPRSRKAQRPNHTFALRPRRRPSRAALPAQHLSARYLGLHAFRDAPLHLPGLLLGQPPRSFAHVPGRIGVDVLTVVDGRFPNFSRRVIFSREVNDYARSGSPQGRQEPL